MSETRPLTIVCLASYEKGQEFMRECKRQNARVLLVTLKKLDQADWPREAIDEIFYLPDKFKLEDLIKSISYLARTEEIDRIVPLDDFDVETAATLREHLRIPGMGDTTARYFRDKLAMRVKARDHNILVPEFVHVLNYERLRRFMQSVPPPWVLKPRSDVSSAGIRKLHEAEQVWRALDELDARERPHERASFHLIERYVAGEVFHVDSVVERGEVVFAGVNRYGRPPMNVAHEGGVFISHSLAHDSAERAALLEINRRVVAALGLRRGATHAEFIRGAEDGEFYFLEIAARVGGAFLAETLEAGTGVNIWREWARLELADEANPYEAPAPRAEHSGIILSLARQEWPDTSAYDDPEIAFRPRKRHHAALVVRSPDHARVAELLDAYARRFAQDFLAVVPPLERPE